MERAFQKKPRLHKGRLAIFPKSISYVPGKRNKNTIKLISVKMAEGPASPRR